MSLTLLKREVSELKNRVNPPPNHIEIAYMLYDVDKPHGFLTGTIWHIVTDSHGTETQWHEAIDSETEVAAHKVYYDKVFGKYKFMADSTHPYSTFEKFMEDQRCKCGRHGLDGKQPYLGES